MNLHGQFMDKHLIHPIRTMGQSRMVNQAIKALLSTIQKKYQQKRYFMKMGQ